MNSFIVSAVVNGTPRKYEISDTGKPRETHKHKYSAGTYYTGGILINDPDGGYIGRFEDWSKVFAFFCLLRVTFSFVKED